jgi:hypothetical protein
MFEEVVETAADAPAPEAATTAAPAGGAAAAPGAEGKWECTVCGTLDGGDTPPAECPVCGADASLFKSIGGGAAAAPTPAAKPTPAAGPGVIDLGPEPESFPGRLRHRIIAQMLKHHAHPVSVHIPNGVIPFSVLFVILAAVSGCRALDIAAQVNMVFVVLTMPFVLYSGYVEWQQRYKGFLSNRFITKIICAVIVTVCAVGVVVWWWIDPAVVQHAPAGFILVNMIMLAAAVVAGLIGGKLVFKD